MKQVPMTVIDELIVIDGQSSDGSAELCHQKGIKVIIQEKMGRGEAFQIAAEAVNSDYLIFLSSDGNEDVGDILKFIDLLDRDYDMVIASRLTQGGRNKDDGKLIQIRKWMLQIFTRIVNLRWHSSLTDVWNGYRAFRVDKLRMLPTTADGHLIELQQTIRALKLGYRIAEFPTIEGDRIAGKTGNSLLKTGPGLIRVLVSEILSRDNQLKK